jgi:hypothetical protein
VTDAQASACPCFVCLNPGSVFPPLMHVSGWQCPWMARLFAACTYLTVGHAVLHVVGAAVALEVGVLGRGAVEGCVGHFVWVVACSRR